jgi:EAL domain-containing protein (putative c-di-GMP-specific phosphodiesterase class I)
MKKRIRIKNAKKLKVLGISGLERDKVYIIEIDRKSQTMESVNKIIEHFRRVGITVMVSTIKIKFSEYKKEKENV